MQKMQEHNLEKELIQRKGDQIPLAFKPLTKFFSAS